MCLNSPGEQRIADSKLLKELVGLLSGNAVGKYQATEKRNTTTCVLGMNLASMSFYRLELRES